MSSTGGSSKSTFVTALAALGAAAVTAGVGYAIYSSQQRQKQKGKSNDQKAGSSSAAGKDAAAELGFVPNPEGTTHTIDPDGWLDADRVINIKMYADNRARLVKRMLAVRAKTHIPSGECTCQRTAKPGDGEAIIVEGGSGQFKYDTDVDLLFRQESNFSWLFAIAQPGVIGTIALETGKTTLFIPRVDAVLAAVWLGPVKPCDWYARKYGVDACYYTDELASVLHKHHINTLHVLDGTTIRAPIKPLTPFPGIIDFTVTGAYLLKELVECRVHKSADEQRVMRHVNAISSRAHIKVMSLAHTCKNERDLESLFLYETYRYGGCRHCSYTCICGSGHTGATLHYFHNDKDIVTDQKAHATKTTNKPASDTKSNADGRDEIESDMLLLDMGAEYYGYASDITCAFPQNGKFTKRQRIIFEAVADSQKQGIELVKPGVSTAEIAKVCALTILKHAVKHGLIVLPSVKDVPIPPLKPDPVTGKLPEVKAGTPPPTEWTIELAHERLLLASYLMPHGFGHLLGLDVHDVGGFFTRAAPRTLTPGVVLTVEPGIYFIPAKLEPAFKDPQLKPFFNADLIRSFYTFGGVRLEDDILVTETGYENLTKCPRTVAEVEAVMAAGKATK